MDALRAVQLVSDMAYLLLGIAACEVHVGFRKELAVDRAGDLIATVPQTRRQCIKKRAQLRRRMPAIGINHVHRGLGLRRRSSRSRADDRAGADSAVCIAAAG